MLSDFTIGYAITYFVVVTSFLSYDVYKLKKEIKELKKIDASSTRNETENK